MFIHKHINEPSVYNSNSLPTLSQRRLRETHWGEYRLRYVNVSTWQWSLDFRVSHRNRVMLNMIKNTVHNRVLKYKPNIYCCNLNKRHSVLRMEDNFAVLNFFFKEKIQTYRLTTPIKHPWLCEILTFPDTTLLFSTSQEISALHLVFHVPFLILWSYPVKLSIICKET